ncbi:MAG TPA: transposase, partial [Anaerolineales bacterium]
MLNTLPPSVAPALRVCPPILRRRRGGQPSNPNALKHGLYAARNQTPFTSVSTFKSSYRQILDKSLDVISQAIPELQEKIVLAFQLSEKAKDTRSLLSWLRLLTKMINVVVRLRTTWFRLQQPARDLHSASQHAQALIRYDFRSQGITRDADSFREKCELSDFNSLTFRESLCASRSDPPYPFITPRQWRVLEPLLPPSDQAGKRGRPPGDPHELLDAIFWKFAQHARWQDLPVGYPPMLSCRRYYRRLFLSGRLATLYSALYQDLRTRGKA